METLQHGTEIAADMQVSITLTAAQWSSILVALDEMPHKIARPLSDKINQAIIKEATPKPEEEEDKVKDNGRKNKKS